MNILSLIKRNEVKAKSRGWDKTFWFIDIHETVIVPNYEYGNIPKDFYPLAKETMQLLSKKEDICLIMYTCSWPDEIEQYLKFFEENEIFFKYVNDNPEVKSSGYGCYDKKPYINVLLDDKAGFDPHTDWRFIFDYLKDSGETLAPLMPGVEYKTKMQTGEGFRIEKIEYKDGEPSMVWGVYTKSPDLGICPISPDRLIRNKMPK